MLGQAFDLSLDALTMPGGLIETARSAATACSARTTDAASRWACRPSLVDVMLIGRQLFDQGRRRSSTTLAMSGCGAEPAFWALPEQIAESLPEEPRTNPSRLGGSREDHGGARRQVQAGIRRATPLRLEHRKWMTSP